MTMERIVRPAERVPVGLTAPRPGFRTTGPDVPALEFGSPGGSVFDVKVSLYNEVVEYKEQTRTVDVARIKNPNNPNQFVDVEAVKQVTIAGRSGRQTTIYTPIKASETIEIRERNRVINGTGTS